MAPAVCCTTSAFSRDDAKGLGTYRWTEEVKEKDDGAYVVVDRKIHERDAIYHGNRRAAFVDELNKGCRLRLPSFRLLSIGERATVVGRPTKSLERALEEAERRCLRSREGERFATNEEWEGYRDAAEAQANPNALREALHKLCAEAEAAVLEQQAPLLVRRRLGRVVSTHIDLLHLAAAVSDVVHLGGRGPLELTSERPHVRRQRRRGGRHRPTRQYLSKIFGLNSPIGCTPRILPGPGC